MIFNLLAYPRSGSDLLRSYICAITGMTPLLPQGHYTLSDILEPYIFPQENKFVRYHYVNEGFEELSNLNSTLMLLVRQPIENIASYIFADKHLSNGINQVDFNEDYYRNFFEQVSDADWSTYSAQYFHNIDFYLNFQGNKFILYYEKIVSDPSILYEYFYGRKIDFNQLSADLLSKKTSKSDPLKVSTAGKDYSFFSKFVPAKVASSLSKAYDSRMSDLDQ